MEVDWIIVVSFHLFICKKLFQICLIRTAWCLSRGPGPLWATQIGKERWLCSEHRNTKYCSISRLCLKLTVLPQLFIDSTLNMCNRVAISFLYCCPLLVQFCYSLSPVCGNTAANWRIRKQYSSRPLSFSFSVCIFPVHMFCSDFPPAY